MIPFRKEKLLDYLNRCRMPDGGYCAFRDPESGAGFSNVADTCFALYSFRRLGKEIPSLPETRFWILRALSEDGGHWRSPFLSWALEAKRLAGMPFSDEDRFLMRQEAARLLSEKVLPQERSGLLRDLVFLFRVRLFAGIPKDPEEAKALSLLLGEGSSASGVPAILEAADRAFLTAPDLPSPGEWPYRHPTLGYVLVPGSSRSDLFILLAGLRMRKDPPGPEEADLLRIRVLFCQGREGGFSPVGGARPTLEATEAALEILARLPGGAPNGAF